MQTIAPLDGFSFGIEGCSSEATLSSHPHIEAVVIHAITDTMAEWRRQLLRGSRLPLDSNSVAARNLITAFDFFLSYGFVRGNRLYWLFVKEFMSRDEIVYLKREWHAASTRVLSVAWLKDTLNKQTLPFYFQSFQQDLKTVMKFYQKEALMANQLLLSRIVRKTMDVCDVQFRFLKPFEKHNEVPVAVMRTRLAEQRPSTSNGGTAAPIQLSQGDRNRHSASHQRSQIRHSKDVSSLLLDIPIPANFVEIHPASFDEDIISPGSDPNQVFDDLLRRKKNDSPNGAYDFQSKGTVEAGRAENEIEGTAGNEQDKLNTAAVTVPVDPFDIALKSSLSKAKLTVEEEQQNGREHRASPTPTLVDLPCGEVKLDMGEVIGLSINVFKHDAERFMRLFQVYSHFGTGEVDKRLLALSNHAVYLLSVESIVIPRKSYVTCAYLPHRYIDCIYVGPDFQVLYLHAKKDCSVSEEADKISPMMEVCTACKQLGIAVLDGVKYAYENYASSTQPEKIKLNVHTDSTPQHVILRRFLSKELHEDSPTLFGYYLAQWRQTNLYSTNGEGYQHSGFLYYKEVRGGISWLLGSSDFQQSYFHLQNKKLYQFSDSTCKFGERVISVRDSVTDVTEVKGNDRSPHMFEIVLDNGTKIQFICQSAAEMRKWISLITLAVTSTDMNDEPAACVVCLCEKSILVVQEGLNCVVDGFIRLLMRIDLACISQATGVFAAERSACVIRNNETLEWLFMRSPDEVDRLLGQLSQLGVRQINTEQGGSSRLSAFLNSMSRSNDIFQFIGTLSDDAFDTSLEL